MRAVPLDDVAQPRFKIRVQRLPSQFAAKFPRINGVTPVMPRTILHPIEVVRRASHCFQNGLQYVVVAPLSVRSDEVRFADSSARENRPHRPTVIVHVNPIANVEAVAVKLGVTASQKIRNLTWDKFLHVLPGAVDVGAVRDRGADAVRSHPRTY